MTKALIQILEEKNKEMFELILKNAEQLKELRSR